MNDNGNEGGVRALASRLIFRKPVVIVERWCYACTKMFKVPESDGLRCCDECLPGEIEKFVQAFSRYIPCP